MSRLWAWITDPTHQKTLSFLGSGLVVVVVAGWTLYEKFFDAPPGPMQTVENACSGDVCNFGITLDQYEQALMRREEALRAELAATGERSDQAIVLEQDLDAVLTRLGNVELAFAQRSARLRELARSLEEGEQEPGVAESFEQAVASGDTAALEAKLREDLDRDLGRSASRAYQLGLLLAQDGRVSDAYEALQTAATLAPEDPIYQSELAEVADQLGVLLGGWSASREGGVGRGW